MKALKTLLIMALALVVLSVGVSAISMSDIAQTENEGTAISTVLPEASGIVGTATYALTNLPTGAAFNAGTRTFTWTPDYSKADVYTMIYTAVDNMGTPADNTDDTSDSVNYVLTISNFNPLSITQDVLLGGSSQHRSNPDAEDDEYQEVYTYKDVTIANNGDIDVAVSLTHVKNTGYTFEYDVTLNDSPSVSVTIPARGTATIELEAYVPEDLPSFFPNRADFNDRKNLLGELRLTSTTAGVSALTTNFYLEAENMLDFDSLNVKADTEDESISNDNEELDNIKPNDNVIISAEIENKYDDNDNEDLEIEDIELLVEINENNFEVDEDTSFDDLKAGEISNEDSIEFVMDYEDVDEDSYSLYITLSGANEHGAVMGKKFEVVLNVELEKDDIAIGNINLDPSTAICKTSTTLSFDLMNIGEDDQDEVAYKVESSLLNLYKSKYDFSIDEDDDDSFSVAIPLDGIKTGDYDIEIASYVDRNEQTDSEVVVLHVEGCKPVVAEEEVVITPEANPNEITGEATTQPPITIIPELESFNEFQNTSVYVILLGGLVVVLTIVLVLLLIKFVF